MACVEYFQVAFHKMSCLLFNHYLDTRLGRVVTTKLLTNVSNKYLINLENAKSLSKKHF